MNTITDYGSVTSSLLTSNYRGQLTSSATSANAATRTGSAAALQKMLGRLDSIDSAVQSFQSSNSRQSSSAVEMLTPATSARLTSTEEINPGANTVDPSGAFDGSNGNAPDFESGLNVNAGTFSVNGIEITVSADDNIYSVLSSINLSAADVTASYNAGEEKIVLTHNALGAGTAINLSDDNSGFLRATKLNDAVVVQGAEAVTRIDNTGAKTRSYKTADMLEELDQAIAAIFAPSGGQSDIYQDALQSALNAVIEEMYKNFGKAQLKKAGLEFTNVDNQFLTLNKKTRRRLVHGLQDGDRYLLDALTANSNSKKGLIPALQETILEHLGSGGSRYVKGTFASYRA